MTQFLILLLILYGTMVCLLYLFQDRLLYFPEARFMATPDELGLRYEEVFFPAADGVRVSAWYVPVPGQRAVVLYCHGNAGNISHRCDHIGIFAGLGLGTFMFDYRGYGKSEGKPSEKGTYMDALGAWDFLVREKSIDPREIILFGESLGGAIAAWTAREKTPGALILQSAFTSLPDLAARLYPLFPVRWLARYDYHTAQYLRGVKCPVLVLHSREDEIVPFDHGLRLYDSANDPKELVELRGDHNSGFMVSIEAYRSGITTFLDKYSGGTIHHEEHEGTRGK